MTEFNEANRHIGRGLNNSIAALYHLQDHGCTVLSVELGQRNPVLWIERPSQFLQGSVFSRVVCNGKVTTTYVARVHGCEVRWEAHGIEQRQAVGL